MDLNHLATSSTKGNPSAIAALRRFARPRPQEERCDLCAATLASEHQHLLEPATRKVMCACGTCAILFSNQGARYRRIPRRIEAWPQFQLSDDRWATLGVPISLAFFYFSTAADNILAAYPSPGGATESAVPQEAWTALAEDNPVLRSLEPDVEALLVNRLNGARECYRVPIDECYKLVGLVRTHWRGMSGGALVWGEVAAFFQNLRRRSPGGGPHA